jgi:hypothetical protein
VQELNGNEANGRVLDGFNPETSKLRFPNGVREIMAVKFGVFLTSRALPPMCGLYAVFQCGVKIPA